MARIESLDMANMLPLGPLKWYKVKIEMPPIEGVTSAFTVKDNIRAKSKDHALIKAYNIYKECTKAEVIHG